MRQFGSEVISYLVAVFVQTQQLVFTVLDILGLILFFYPNALQSIGWDLAYVRLLGGALLAVSFFLANFRVYHGLIQQLVVRADIRITFPEGKAHYFYPQFERANPSPFPDERSQIEQLRQQGLPGWATLRIPMRLANHGWGEVGTSKLELVKAKTKLPALFNIDKAKRQFFEPKLEPRQPTVVDCMFFFPFTEQDPQSFIRALKALVQDGQKYKIVLRYWTERLGGEVSPSRKLTLVGDFQYFYEQTLKHWDIHDKPLHELAKG